MLYRYADKIGLDISASGDIYAFPDGDRVSEFAQKAMSWAIGAGIITGDNGNINPQGDVSRAVCATMISRMDNVGILSEHTHNWVAQYQAVTVQAAYDEPVYEEQPVYETVTRYRDEPVYGVVTVCACGADVSTLSSADFRNGGAHDGHGCHTETRQTGIQSVAYQETVQTGTQQVQVGTKHHDAVTEKQLTGYKCSCGATK